MAPIEYKYNDPVKTKLPKNRQASTSVGDTVHGRPSAQERPLRGNQVASFLTFPNRTSALANRSAQRVAVGGTHSESGLRPLGTRFAPLPAPAVDHPP